jgi:hypothetical protein
MENLFMSGLFGGLAGLLGGGAVTNITLLGILAFLLLKPERIIEHEKFRLSVILLVASIALPALIGMFFGLDSSSGTASFFLRLTFTASTLANAGSVYLFITSLSLVPSNNQTK